MTKIERRKIVVSLLPGNFEQDLADLAQEAIAAAEFEQQGGPKRAGQRSKAIDLAKKHDQMKAESDAVAVKVPVWALGYAELPALRETHLPREGVDEDDKPKFPLDQVHGVNMQTFPHALLCASLVDPDNKHEDIAAKVAAGAGILDEDLDPSALHYKKLETGAWNVNMGGENLPKVSLVSLLMEASESESREPSEPE
jgi:hypothetical protein